MRVFNASKTKWYYVEKNRLRILKHVHTFRKYFEALSACSLKGEAKRFCNSCTTLKSPGGMPLKHVYYSTMNAYDAGMCIWCEFLIVETISSDAWLKNAIKFKLFWDEVGPGRDKTEPFCAASYAFMRFARWDAMPRTFKALKNSRHCKMNIVVTCKHLQT